VTYQRQAGVGPFTDDDVARALTMPLPVLAPGQVNRARRFRLGGWAVYVKVNTGPPTWWLPRVHAGDGAVMLGWLRGLVAVAVRRA
jgi:hypothetical protein